MAGVSGILCDMDPFHPNSRFGKPTPFAPPNSVGASGGRQTSTQKASSQDPGTQDTYNHSTMEKSPTSSSGASPPGRPQASLSAGNPMSGATLKGGFSRLPASVQKALSAKSTRSGSQPASSSEESNHAPSARSSSDLDASSESGGPLGEDSLASQAKHARIQGRSEISNFLRTPAGQDYSEHQNFQVSLAASSNVTFASSRQGPNQYIERSVTLPGHHLIATGNLVPANVQIFERVGWRSIRHLTDEGAKHPELNKKVMLDAVHALGVSRTGVYIHAYIYANGHRSSDPRQSRQPGDVLFIDEKKGVLAAFTSSGVVKTARVDNPAVLRMYLHEEKFKDSNRYDLSSSGDE